MRHHDGRPHVSSHALGQLTACASLTVLGLVLLSGLEEVASISVPKQQTADCSTLIVTNERRLGLPKSDSPRPSTSGCIAARQPKKLPSTVGRLFREEVDNYPEDEIKQILKQTPTEVKDLYNVLNTQLDPHTNLTERTFYSDEEAYLGEREENVCRTVTRNVYPREANLRNSLVYIANNQDFMQVIQAEICQSPDQDCSYLRDNLPYGFSSACVQKYSYKKMLYMNPRDKRMATDLFRYPSCCVCMVRTLPLDLRSSQRVNQTISANGTLVVAASSENPGESEAGGNNSLGAASPQVADRSVKPDTSQPDAARRQSKRLKQPTNQTVILSDDKVYAPTS